MKPMFTHLRLLFALLTGLSLTPAGVRAAETTKTFEIELRLVANDRPDTTVEKFEVRRPVVNPVSTGRGVNMQEVGVEVVCWSRNVRLDGKPIFERYHEGRYIDRLPIAKATLAPGEHKIWPGDHVFSVAADGAVTSTDEDLLIEGPLVRVRMYPVTIGAYRANPDETDLPMSMRGAPLPNATIRDATDMAVTLKGEGSEAIDEKPPEKSIELLPIYEKFAPLTVWLPGNKLGAGYVVHPLGLTFHLGRTGIVPGAGGGASIEGVKIEGARIVVPLYGFPASGSGGTTLLVPGVERIGLDGSAPARSLTNWYPRRKPYALRVAEVGPALHLDGDVSRMPVKALSVQRTGTGGAALVSMEMENRELQSGQTINLRLGVMDASAAMAAKQALKRVTADAQKSAAALAAAKTRSAQAEGALAAAQKDLEAKRKAMETAADAEKALAGKAVEESQTKVATADTAAKAALTELEAAAVADTATKGSVEAAARKLAEAEKVNTAESWAPAARLKLEGTDAWIDLPIELAPQEKSAPAATAPATAPALVEPLTVVPRQASLRIPLGLTDGVYRLEIGARNEEGAVLASTNVSVATKRPVSAGLFTLRGRDAFYCGESFWLALGVRNQGTPIPAGADVKLRLVDAAGKAVDLISLQTRETIASQSTIIVRLSGATTLSLEPGVYRVEGTFASQPVRGIPLTLVDPEPGTHFTNLLNGKYHPLGGAMGGGGYGAVLSSGSGGEALIDQISGAGYNAFLGMAYAQNRVTRHNPEIEQLVRDRPDLGPWEAWYQRSGRDSILNAAVRHNLRFYEDLFTYNDTMLPREANILAACDRYAALETQSLRYSPAFRGICFYDEIYFSSIIGIPQNVLSAVDTAVENAYRERFREQGLTSAKAARALERFLARQPGQRNPQDVEAFKTWQDFEDGLWQSFSSRMQRVVKSSAPRSTNFTLHRAWGSNGGNLWPNGTSTGVFADLDVASTVMYKDGGQGDRPVFGAMMADALRVRDDIPVWTQIHGWYSPGHYSDSHLRDTFLSLSQKIEGISFFTLAHDAASPSHNDDRDTIRSITQGLTVPYGDFLLSLEKGYRKVAVVASRQASLLQSRKAGSVAHAAELLWVACLRAGYPADFLYDDQLLAGKAGAYEAVFIPGFTIEQEIRPDLREAIQRLVHAGKIVLVERSCKLDVEGVVRLDSELDEFEDRLGGAFPRYIDEEFNSVFNLSEQTTALVRSALAKRITPAAVHDLLVGPDWQKHGKGEYLFVANYADTGFNGLRRTLYQAPATPVLRIPKREGVCYDMLEMARVEMGAEGEWTTVRPDMRAYPGKILAFLPSPIERVELRSNVKIEKDRRLHFEVAVVDSQGAVIDASFPVEITLRDPAGGVRSRYWRAATPKYVGVIPIGVNATVGTWKLSVRELVSGAVSEAALEVVAGSSVNATVEDRVTRVFDEAKVRDFMAGKEPITIALDTDQAWVKPLAEKLKAGLAARGREVKIANAQDVIRLPGHWGHDRGELDGTRLWRGEVVEPGLFIDAPMVLLGKRYESRLIEALVRRDVLPEPLTSNFPGAGRALVGVADRAFHNVFPTLYVLGVDEAGLSAGVAALLGDPVNLKGEPAQPVLVPVNADVKTELSNTGKSSPSQPSGAGEKFVWRDWVTALDVDEATGRSLVGTRGYGQNLFCLGPDGKPIWKQFLPEHHVYRATWIDGGKRVIAATGRGWLFFILDGTDGKVIRKLSATEWPDFHGSEGAVDTEHQIVVNPVLRQVIVLGRTGVMALDFDGKKMWFLDRAAAITTYPAETEQTGAAEFVRSGVASNITLSPDGNTLIYGEYRLIGSTPGHAPGEINTLWQFFPMLVDARTGEVRFEWRSLPADITSPSGWGVSWPRNAAEPRVHRAGRVGVLTNKDVPPAMTRDVGGELPGGDRLSFAPLRVERIGSDGKPRWSYTQTKSAIPSLDRLTADSALLFRCDMDGVVTSVDLATGKSKWSYAMPWSSMLLPTKDGLLAGDKAGHVTLLDLTGKPRWSVHLATLNEPTGTNYQEYLRAALRRDVDASGEFYPSNIDTPGEYDKTLRRGVEQVVNGGFESRDAWKVKSGELTIAQPGRASGAALSIAPAQLVTQAIARRVVPSATYLLEFHYRVESDETTLVAGADCVDDAGKHMLTASEFRGRPGVWTFGRLAIKTAMTPGQMELGFEASRGKVLVDDVSCYPVRFPSANLLANADLHAIEPTFVKDIRVQYDRIPGSLRERLMRTNHVVAFKQAAGNTATIYTQEQAFLHNGRLDDLGPVWAYPPDSMGFSVALTRQSWVSHLVLYLNNAEPDNTYRTIAVLVNNVKTKVPETVALVRGNQKRFVVVKFEKPLLTDSLKIMPLHPGHRECLTEVEVYGPLSGPEETLAPAPDPDAWPMFMATPSHVPAVLPSDVKGVYAEASRIDTLTAYHAGATALDGVLSYGTVGGSIGGLNLDNLPTGRKPGKAANMGWALQSITPMGTPARHLGRLLSGSADGRLHAVADNGSYLWGFQTGGRVRSSPTPDGDDVYCGSDDGKLYKLDVHSGTLVWEVSTQGPVRGSPALAGGRVFFTSGEGALISVDAVSGLVSWKTPIAANSRSSAAVAGGRVYVGDEAGMAYAIDAGNGNVVWKQQLSGYISACPLVTPEGVVFVTEKGDTALIAPDGAVKWRVALNLPVMSQPIATATQVLAPSAGVVRVINRGDGSTDAGVTLPGASGNVNALLAYRGSLLLVQGWSSTNFSVPPRTYGQYGGVVSVWQPKPPDKTPGGKP